MWGIILYPHETSETDEPVVSIFPTSSLNFRQ